MLLISNQLPKTHLAAIKAHLAKAEEVVISVAFLKKSGLKPLEKLLASKERSCTFYVGTDYYLTEPQALRALAKHGHAVNVVKAGRASFHPKLYWFRTKGKSSLIVGSANMTGGGLSSNFEVSAYFEISKVDGIEKQFHEIIDSYKKNSTLVDDLWLSQYERKYDIYKATQKKAKKEFEQEIQNIQELDFSKLDKYLKEYYDSGGEKRFRIRMDRYEDAKLLLDKLSKAKIGTPSEFLAYYDEIAKYFYSTGLLRGKKTFSKKYKTILAILDLVKKNRNAKPEVIFSKALPLVNSVKNYGVNGLTEMMTTYNPQMFSVVNGLTLGSLAELFKKYPVANNFNANTYKEYNDLIMAIAKKCKFQTLGQVDHFLTFYYLKYVKKQTKSQVLKQL